VGSYQNIQLEGQWLQWFDRFSRIHRQEQWVWERVFEVGRVSKQIERCLDDSCESGFDLEDITEDSSRKRTYSISECGKNIVINLAIELAW